MGNIANRPTPPLDTLNDLPGEPISPEMSDSDVYLNADDAFDQGQQTSTSCTFQNTDVIPNVDETSKVLHLPSELDTGPNLAITEDDIAITTEELPSTEVTQESETISNTEPIDDAKENLDIGDNETVEEADIKDEREQGEPSMKSSLTDDKDDKNIHNDIMEVDTDERGCDAEDVEMKDREDEHHGDSDHISSTKESHSKSDDDKDESSDKLTDELNDESRDETKDDIHENVDESLNQTDDLHENDDATLNQTSDQSGRNLDDSDSFLNDCASNEKHHTEEVDMANVENVRDTNEKTAEDPFDTVRNNTSGEEMNNDLEKQQLALEVSETYTNDTTTVEGDAEDDIEQGKGKEREISKADKERAHQAEEDAAKESTKPNESDQVAEIEVAPPSAAYPQQKNIAKSRKNVTATATNVQIISVVELEPLPSNLFYKNVSKYQASKRNNISYEPTPAPPPPPPRVEVNTQIITVPPLPTRVTNMAIMCKPAIENKEIMSKPTVATIGCQTESHLGGQRGRKRGPTRQNRNIRAQVSPPSKRGRRQEMPVMIPQPEPPREPVEKADANKCLKFTFGVYMWKQLVMKKNADLEKSSIRRKPFKSELLELTADELNYSLCLFVKEVRKPNGSEYAPDEIYYLVLGIQKYLNENGRIDNIFTDPYYEKFTDCLDDVAKKFSVLYNHSQYIVTCVEEEHLWKCKQLGAHSPHVLLTTLMFFNTKHFNLTTVEEHMQLSFSQVGASKLPGSRNVLLRFYPPQSSLDNNSRKKKVYEQQENEENPFKCPVKLYEFYLSKCPKSVKTRNDVFYLQPKRSCVPDSPAWYSTQAVGKKSLCKMLHRVKMVKEINIALSTN